MQPMIIRQIEVEVNILCNLECSYCPVSRYPSEREALMPMELFDRLLNQLSQIDFEGILSFHRYNEPTLRQDLETLVEKARMKLPDAKILLVSNGTLLNQSRIQGLFQAGVDEFLVTDHAQLGIGSGPAFQVLQPEELELSTRAGWLDSVPETLVLPCFAPEEILIVGYNGDVYLCAQDYGRDHVMGNLGRQSLSEIWHGNTFRRYRQLLAQGLRSQACELCSRCDGTEYVQAKIS